MCNLFYSFDAANKTTTFFELLWTNSAASKRFKLSSAEFDWPIAIEFYTVMGLTRTAA